MSDRKRALFDLLRQHLMEAFMAGDAAKWQAVCKALRAMCATEKVKSGRIRHHDRFYDPAGYVRYRDSKKGRPKK